MERKTDLRIIKTKKAIKTAFLNLLKENKYHNITISAISETALINRKTAINPSTQTGRIVRMLKMSFMPML